MMRDIVWPKGVSAGEVERAIDAAFAVCRVGHHIQNQMPRDGFDWQEWEYTYLLNTARAGLTASQQAIGLGRTQAAVATKRSMIGANS